MCDSVTCIAPKVDTTIEYCGGLCEYDQCCGDPPTCDPSYDCTSVNLNSRVDWNRICDVSVDGECAPSEYELGKCCTTSTTSCSQYGLWDVSLGGDVAHDDRVDSHAVGNPMPGCKEKEGYISWYTNEQTGGSFTDESFGYVLSGIRFDFHF